MPTIAYFYGIAIRMFLNDHNPPHFHAIYGECEGRVAIATGEVVDGYLPKTAARLVKEWTLAHRDELMDNWERARTFAPLKKVTGLDAE